MVLGVKRRTKEKKKKGRMFSKINYE